MMLKGQLSVYSMRFNMTGNITRDWSGSTATAKNLTGGIEHDISTFILSD